MPNTPVFAHPTARSEYSMDLLRGDPDVNRMSMLAGRSAGIEIGDIHPVEASATVTSETVISPAVGEITEGFDAIACLDNRVRHRGNANEPVEPGRYIQIQGPDRTLLIPLGDEITHIGRGLAADLHFDDSSVSRRHAVLVPRPSGQRILDDRSFNGTFVNGRRIEQLDLHNGDVIGLGRVVLRYLVRT